MLFRGSGDIGNKHSRFLLRQSLNIDSSGKVGRNNKNKQQQQLIGFEVVIKKVYIHHKEERVDDELILIIFQRERTSQLF